MNNLKGPIKVFGGKGNMFNKILPYFPKSSEYTTYIEPFSGGFTLGLRLDSIPPIMIYNDLEKNVYSLYKVLSDKNYFEKFKEKCDLAYYSEDIRTEFKENLKNNNLSIVDRAFYFFYVNRTSFNGIGGFPVTTVIRRKMSKSISDFLSSIDRLYEIHQRLSKVIVLNTDGIELIKKYNDSKTLFYCDPPYEQSTRTSARYNVDMTRQEHIKFLDAVINSNAKILISGYDCELYDILTQNSFKKINFEIKTVDGVRKPKTKIESLWLNY